MLFPSGNNEHFCWVNGLDFKYKFISETNKLEMDEYKNHDLK